MQEKTLWVAGRPFHQLPSLVHCLPSPLATTHFSRTLPSFYSFLPSSLPNVQALKISKGVCLPCVGQGGCVRQDGLGVGAKTYSPYISVIKGKSSFFPSCHVSIRTGRGRCSAPHHPQLGTQDKRGAVVWKVLSGCYGEQGALTSGS